MAPFWPFACVLLLAINVLFLLICVQPVRSDTESDEDLPKLNANESEKAKTLYDFYTRVIAYKDLIESKCYLELMRTGARTTNLNSFTREGLVKTLLASENQLTKQQVWNMGGARISEFCRGYPTFLLQQYPRKDEKNSINEISTDSFKNRRRRRSSQHYFRGRVRGQTQSQYLSFGNGQNEGKAEAESTYDGSKAVVVGSNGMGSAQSQSIPYGCDDCYGTGTGTQEQTLHVGHGGIPRQPIKPSSYIPGHTAEDTQGIPGYRPGLPGGVFTNQGQIPSEIQTPGQHISGAKPVDSVQGQPLGPGGYVPGQIQGQPQGPGSFVSGQTHGQPQISGQTQVPIIPGAGAQFYAPGQQTLAPGSYRPGQSIPSGPPITTSYIPGGVPSQPQQGQYVPGKQPDGYAHVSHGQLGGYPPGQERPGDYSHVSTGQHQRPGDYVQGPQGGRPGDYTQGKPNNYVQIPQKRPSNYVQGPQGRPGDYIQGPQGKPGGYVQGPQGRPGDSVQGPQGIPGHYIQGSPGSPGQFVQGQQEKPGQYVHGGQYGKPGEFVQGPQGRPGYTVHGRPGEFMQSQQGRPGDFVQGQQGRPSDFVHGPQGRPGQFIQDQHGSRPGEFIQGQHGRPGGFVQGQPGTSDQFVQYQPGKPGEITQPSQGQPNVQSQQIGVPLPVQAHYIPGQSFSQGQTQDHKPGQFSGNISGDYQTNVGRGGKFSGIFSGQYGTDAGYTSAGPQRITEVHYPGQGPGSQTIFGAPYPGQISGTTGAQQGIRGQQGTTGVSYPGQQGISSVSYPGRPGIAEISYPGQPGTASVSYPTQISGQASKPSYPGQVGGAGSQTITGGTYPGLSGITETVLPGGAVGTVVQPSSTKPLLPSQQYPSQSGGYIQTVGPGNVGTLPAAHPPGTAPPYGVSGTGTSFGTPSAQISYGTPGTQQFYGTPDAQIPYGGAVAQPSYGTSGVQPPYGTHTGGKLPYGTHPGGQQSHGTSGSQTVYGTSPGAQSPYGTPGSQTSYGIPGTQSSYGTPGVQTYGTPGVEQTSHGAPGIQTSYNTHPGAQSTYGTPGAGVSYAIPGTSPTYGSSYGVPGAAPTYGGHGVDLPTTGPSGTYITQPATSGKRPDQISIPGGQIAQYPPGGAQVVSGQYDTGKQTLYSPSAGQQFGPDQYGPAQATTQYKPSQITVSGEGAPASLYGAGVNGDDDADSQAQTSVQQINNETQASASAQGRYQSGLAQSQVSGSYLGTGSFSASAGTNDGKRGAQTQVSGGKEGATSSAQGSGGMGLSQAQVQLASESGDTISSAQSGGYNHGSNTQVQASSKGGMADAQANGPGSTSSQAQIGFTPNNDSDDDDGQKVPFRGGGTASAQSGTHTGQTQSQIQGKFRYGIKYTGAAQAGSGNKESILIARNQTRPTGLTGNFPSFKPLKITSTNDNAPTEASEQTTKINQSQQKIDDLSVNMVQQRKFPVNNPTENNDGDDYDDDYDDYDEEDQTQKPSTKSSAVINQRSGTQQQHIILDPLENIDATVQQAYGESELPDGTIIQPGQIIPGFPGYQIPLGFRGRVSSLAGTEKTTATGYNSQAQSVTLKPGTGQIVYNPPIYAVSSNTHLQKGGYTIGSGYTYQPIIQRQLKSGQKYPNFVSLSKSETGSQNIYTGKKTPSVYYTQSSSCGYFTNTCVFNKGSKICIPKPKTNPDGSPIVC